MFLILLVDVEGLTSNSLFDTLSDWEAYLKGENIDIHCFDEAASGDVDDGGCESDSSPPKVRSSLSMRGPSL